MATTDRNPARCFRCNAATGAMFELCWRCGQVRYQEESTQQKGGR